MGSAVVGAPEGPEVIFINPAGLGCHPATLSLSFFMTKPFGLDALCTENASCVFFTRFGGIGFGIQHFGYKLYSETLLRLSWGYGIDEDITWGINLNTACLSIQNYGTVFKVLLDTGFQVSLSNRLTAGGFFSNLTRIRLDDEADPVPQIIRTGLAYRPFSEMVFCLELEKDTRFPLVLKGGAEFCILPRLFVRCGFTSDPSVFSCGLGFSVAGLHFDYACSSHMILGTTHQASAGFYLFSSKNDQK